LVTFVTDLVQLFTVVIQGPIIAGLYGSEQVDTLVWLILPV
jgi:hypothetical protein